MYDTCAYHSYLYNTKKALSWVKCKPRMYMYCWCYAPTFFCLLFSDCVDMGFLLQPSLNFCYQISTSQATWSDAFDDCDAKDAHLVLIDSQNLNDFLMEQLNTCNHILLISLPKFIFSLCFSVFHFNSRPKGSSILQMSTDNHLIWRIESNYVHRVQKSRKCLIK